jgi:hypothetical protein
MSIPAFAIALRMRERRFLNSSAENGTSDSGLLWK